MIKITNFEKIHIEKAKALALMNYNEERTFVTDLPYIQKLPELENFADNDLGVSMFKEDTMVGFLCCYDPWENAFDSMAKGTFSPIHSHGAVFENRSMIYKKLYQAAAEKWVEKK